MILVLKAVGLALSIMGIVATLVVGFVWTTLHTNFWVGVGVCGVAVFILLVAMIYSWLAEGSTKP